MESPSLLPAFLPLTPFLRTVQILLGSNSGTFSQGAALPVAANLAQQQFPQGMAAVALTNDGNLDLVVPTNVLNVFHGDGKGGFTPTGAYAVTTQAGLGAAYLFADANGDGNQDLIVAGLSSEVFIFPGNGDGTLQAPPGASVSGPVADVNNDGIADMVFLPAQGGNYFGTALGRGDGSFAILNQTTPMPAAQTGYSLMTGDFNGDGKTDAHRDSTWIRWSQRVDLCRLQMPNCSRISEVVTGGSRLREQLSLWESAEQAQELPVILIPTETSTSFFPTTAIRRDSCFCLGMGMGRLAPPSPSMYRVGIIQCRSSAI